MRELKSVVKWLYIGFITIGILFSAAYIFFPYYTVTLVTIDLGYYAFLFALLMPLVFLVYPATKKASQKVPWYDILLALLAFGGFVWIGVNGYEARRAGWTMIPPLYVSVIGAMLWALSLEAGRRTGGIAFAAVIFLFSLLPYYGRFLPAPFTTPEHPLLRIPANYLLDIYGVFGPATKALFKYVLGFLFFGSTLQFMGGGVYLIRVALTMVGAIRGATAKVSVVASGIFGMLSGSSLANVVTTGTITIPAMKESGYPSHYAAAMEACASTGGYIMPPVMGAVAFVMAEITAIPYVDIALAAFIPGFLYYLAIFIQSDFRAIKLGIKPVPKAERPKLSLRLLLEGWDYFLATAVLIYYIFGLRLVSQAPFMAMIPLLIGGFIKKKLTLKTVPDLIYSIGGLLVSMIGIFACLGLVTGSVLFTGFGLAVSAVMFRVGAGNILWLVLLGGFVAMILGMGVTVTAVYILVAITLCPALEQLGLNLMAVHLFVLYFAGVAAFTPPVGTSALAAARLAGAGYMKTGYQAMRLGAVMFLIPFYFVHEPALVLQGTALETVISLAIAIFAIIMFSAGFEQYMYGIGKITIPETLAAIASGLLIILPVGQEVTLVGWILAGALIVYWIIRFLSKRVRARSGA